MVTMSTMLLWNYPDSTMRIKMANFTQSTALIIREAQIRGSAVDSRNGDYAGYGVFFNIDGASSSEITLFADEVIPGNYVNGILEGDGLLSTTTVTEIKSITTLPAGYSVSKLCVTSGNASYCNASTSPEITTLTISFIRPNSQPHIYVNGSNSLDPELTAVPAATLLAKPYTGACVELSSPHAPAPGHVRSIKIQGAGFITVKVAGCE